MKVALGLGLMEYPFDTAAGFWRWVDLCEQAGADSLWQTDRIVSRAPILECMAVLAALAGRTRRLKFGMNVVSLALARPGAGGQAMRHHRRALGRAGCCRPSASAARPRRNGRRWTSTPRRAAGVTDEALEIIARLWREDSVDFAGRHFTLKGAGDLAASRCSPTCRCGSAARRTAAIRRTARYGTGWQAGGETPAEAAAGHRRHPQEGRGRSGRTIDEDHYGAGFPFHFGCPSDPPAQRAMAAYAARTGRDPARGIVAGDAAAILHRIAEYVEAGVDEIHPAPGRPRRRGAAGADPAADGTGAAAGRGALAEGGRCRKMTRIWAIDSNGY